MSYHEICLRMCLISRQLKFETHTIKTQRKPKTCLNLKCLRMCLITRHQMPQDTLFKTPKSETCLMKTHSCPLNPFKSLKVAYGINACTEVNDTSYICICSIQWVKLKLVTFSSDHQC